MHVQQFSEHPDGAGFQDDLQCPQRRVRLGVHRTRQVGWITAQDYCSELGGCGEDLWIPNVTAETLEFSGLQMMCILLLQGGRLDQGAN